MRGNHICDQACFNSACSNDGGDCVSLACSPDCYLYMLSDGECQAACRTQACGWDSNDCDCVPGCTPDLLGNSACDQMCDFEACEFDKGHCGSCASGCFSEDIGNSHCDPKCNVESCEWDGLDCGCAPGCNVPDYGTCKTECLVPNCVYDQMQGHPACLNAALRKSALYFHIYYQDFSKPYSLELCYSAYSCTAADWESSQTNCLQNCNFPACGFSLAHCGNPADCPSPCESCVEGNHTPCLECKTGYMQTFTSCSLYCPHGFLPHSLLTGICYPLQDETTADAPIGMYVTTESNGNGNGTYANPYDSLAKAFDALRFKYTVLYLFPGTHTLTPTSVTAFLSTWSESTNKKVSKSLNVTIAGFRCSQDPTAPLNCTSTRPVLLLDNQNPVLVKVSGVVQFRDVDISAESSLVPECTSQTSRQCIYCASITTDALGNGVSDRGNFLKSGTFAPQSACQPFLQRSFVEIDIGASLTFASVSILNFRQGYSSLFSLSSAFLSFVSVTFTNTTIGCKAMPAPGASTYIAVEAVIVQTVPSNAAYLEGRISLDNCTVELMNNGFEFSNGLVQGGFLSAKGIHTISIRNSTFQNCLIPSTMLINIGNTLSFSIDFTRFLTIYAGQNLIRLSPANSPTTYQEATSSVISLTNSEFLRCSILLPGANFGSLFMVLFSTVFLNIHVENVTMISTLSKGSAIYIFYPGTQLPQDKAGYTVITRNATSRTETDFPKKWARLKNITIDSSVSSGTGVFGLVFLSGIMNLELSHNLIRDSADYEPNESINTKTFQYLIGTQGEYLSKFPPNQPLTHCTKIITFQRVYNATTLSNTFLNTKCLDSTGSAGIHSAGGQTGDFIVNGLKVDGLTGTVPSTASCLHIAATNDVFISNLDIRNSVFTAAGCVRIASSLSLTNTIDNSYFFNNTGPAAVCQAVISYGLNLTNVVFEKNTSPTQAGLYFQTAPGLPSVKLGIYDSVFVGNRGGMGAAVYIANSPSPASPLSLRIKSCEFADNLGTGSGSAIYIENTNPMASGYNSISRCIFQNALSEKGAIGVAYLSGRLTIDSCSFLNSTVSFGAEITGKIGQNAWAIAATFQSTQSALTLKVSNCIFQQGRGATAIVFSSSNENATLVASNNTFLDNSSRAISLERGSLTDSESTYLRNSGECFFVGAEAWVNITSADMQGNQGYYAGAIYLGGGSTGYCDNCTLRNCSSWTAGGAIYVEQSSILHVSNSYFKENTAKSKGSAVSIFGSQAANSIQSTIFEENMSREGGTVSCLASSLSVKDCTFRANLANFAPGILLYLSTISIDNSTFSDQQSTSGVFIYAAIQTYITINNSRFEGSVATGTGGVIFLISADIDIHQTTFRNNSAFSAPIFHSDSSTLSLSKSLILNTVSSQNAEGMLIMFGGSCHVDSTLIQNYTNGGFKLSGLTNVTFSHVVFVAGNSTQGGALSAFDCGSIEVAFSEFYGLNATVGSGLYMFRDSRQDNVYVVDNCKFENLTGGNSGAIDMHQVDVIIHASSFRACKAVGPQGQGGAVHSDCPDSQQTCKIQIEDCNFEGNFAAKQGGGISWLDSKPVLEGNMFTDNVALYGPDVASFPVSIDVAMIAGNGTVEQLGEDESKIGVRGVLRGCASGQIAEYTVLVDVLDHYSQQVYTENSLVAGISGGSAGTSVFGNATTQAIAGRFSFSGFGVTAIPGKTTVIYISSNGVLQDSSKSTAIFALRVEMRECSLGESLVGIQCVVCPEGKYSLDATTTCQQCLSEAICYGNYTMVPQSGYWRANMFTDVFWECPNHDACIGSPEPPHALSYTGLCADGYYGNLCNGCKSGFSRQSSIDCIPCPSFIVNVVKMVGIGIGVLLALVIIIKTSISSARKPRSQYSIFIKILLNYFQLVMLTASFSLQWPSYMKELFRIQETAGNITDQVFSIDCFLDTQKDDSQANTVRMKVLGISFLPIVILLGSLLLWLPIAVFKRKRALLKNEMVATVVIFFFLVHPSIVKFMFNFLNCRALIPGEYWMAQYLNIKCWDYIHTRYALVVAVPSIVAWGIGTPLICLLVLYQNKSRLQLLEMKLRLGFIYNGYEPNKYYWEFVILYRKIIIICLAVFLTNISVPIQALTVMIVLLGAFGLQIKHKPYVVATMNSLEVKAILVAAVTIYCGLYYMTNSVNPQSQLILFIVVVTINAYFLLNWLYRVFEIGFQTARNYIPCLKRLFTRGSRMHVIKPLGETAIRSSDMQKSNLDISQLDDSEELHDSRVVQVSRSPASALNVPDNSLISPS